MSGIKHTVEQQQGVSVHREFPAKRAADDFDVSLMSRETRDAFKRVCRDGGATPEDYRHVLEAILRRKVVEVILQ